MKEVDPSETSRALSYQFYIDAPMPMVTIFKTLNVTNALKLTACGYKFNMLMCYCIGLAAQEVEEFFLLPVGKKLIQYQSIGINVIVANSKGGINSCDIPFSKNLDEFNRSYIELTEQVAQSCENCEIADAMIIGTSNLAKYNIDGVVNMYSGIFNNPFLIWGKYEDAERGTSLKLSFQFHHVQMDGQEACQFLENLQNQLDKL